MALASIRMSQSKFDEAKGVVAKLYADMEDRDPCELNGETELTTVDPLLPPLPVRLAFSRLLLEQNMHLEALDILATVREEDSLEVEAAYLEGWTWHLRAETLLETPQRDWADMDDDDEPMNADECFAESLRALLECRKLFEEQEYPDQGIGGHLQELIAGLEKRGVRPAVHEEIDEEGEGMDME